ncbi:beta-lactamase superfamily domain-containing protein [Chytriomyces cf. hyalinus JEL632]|nr:beta-lactamase superfamily domain-containing protein [Chytriomyces cf. hyalinus JEL632]
MAATKRVVAGLLGVSAAGLAVWQHQNNGLNCEGRDKETWTPNEERMLGSFSVTKLASKVSDKSHHLPDGAGFKNPWASFQSTTPSFSGIVKALMNLPTAPQSKDRLKVRPIDFDALARVRALAPTSNSAKDMSLTWLGHAAFLLNAPGITVLLDPCLSDRCSPVSFAGPQRMVQPPCKLEELDVDVVVISHNHYDHLDLDVMKKLAVRKPEIIFFVPLGNKNLLVEAGLKNVLECDWWDSYELRIPKTDAVQESPKSSSWFKTASAPADMSAQPAIQITCTPCQHFSSRSLFDRNATLWSSWFLQTPTKRFFFGGDTGYRTVRAGDDEDTVPTCPAFKDIRTQLGSPDLSALPIGAFRPREWLSAVHCSPKDAVDVHTDLQSKKSVGMHWGTFSLAGDDYWEPRLLLTEELQKRGIPLEDFITVEVGETVVV